MNFKVKKMRVETSAAIAMTSVFNSPSQFCTS